MIAKLHKDQQGYALSAGGQLGWKQSDRSKMDDGGKLQQMGMKMP